MCKELEFNVGDIVTYKPYEIELKARVITAKIEARLITQEKEATYTLKGLHVSGKTTGKYILESKYYIKPDNENGHGSNTTMAQKQ